MVMMKLSLWKKKIVESTGRNILLDIYFYFGT